MRNKRLAFPPIKTREFIVKKLAVLLVFVLFCQIIFAQENNISQIPASSETQKITTSSSTTKTISQPDVVPGSRQWLKKILTEFERDIVRIKGEWNIPGMSVAAVIDGKIVYRKSFGIKDTILKEPIDNRTVFQIGSVSKGFTSMLVAILDDKNYLSFDDKVINFLPNFKFSSPQLTQEMTIEDLLSQNSGLMPYSQHFMLLFGYSRRQIIDSIRYIRTHGTFRQTYAYQNNLFLLAGEVMQKASKLTWEQNLKKHILEPIGMNSTTSDLESFINAPNRSYGHYYKNGSLTPASDDLPYQLWPYTFAPAGGINTNIVDFSKWLLFLTRDGVADGKRLVSEQNIDRIFTKRVHNQQQGYYYCLGWRLTEHDWGDNFWHGGTTDMQGAYISFVRGKNIGVAILMNLNNVPAAESITLSLYDLYFMRERTDWSKKRLQRSQARRKSRENAVQKVQKIIPPQELQNYVGKYSNSLYGIVEVKLENKRLKFSAGSFKTWLTLKHYNKDSFGAIDIPGWSFKKAGFRFTTDKNSKVVGLIVNDMSDGVDSVFRKVN